MRSAAFLLLFVLACSPRGAQSPEAGDGPLDLEQARRYVLALVNADREAEGLSPVAYDEVAEGAGQAHANDMAALGYTAHWGSDGSVPEERYTWAGGAHFVQENAACFGDGVARELDPKPQFLASSLLAIQRAFMAELPPQDGHRKNILKPSHTALGIGLSQPKGLGQPCMAQEFVDERGSYAPLPRSARVGGVIKVRGEVTEAVSFGGVGLSRIEPRRPLLAKKLNTTYTYPIPAPYVTYFPEGYQTPKPVQVEGRRFAIDLTLSDQKRPGRYGVSIWGAYPEAPDKLVMLSLRVIDVK
jgi:uncharacterized protein YkwD